MSDTIMSEGAGSPDPPILPCPLANIPRQLVSAEALQKLNVGIHPITSGRLAGSCQIVGRAQVAPRRGQTALYNGGVYSTMKDAQTVQAIQTWGFSLPGEHAPITLDPSVTSEMLEEHLLGVVEANPEMGSGFCETSVRTNIKSRFKSTQAPRSPQMPSPAGRAQLHGAGMGPISPDAHNNLPASGARAVARQPQEAEQASTPHKLPLKPLDTLDKLLQSPARQSAPFAAATNLRGEEMTSAGKKATPVRQAGNKLPEVSDIDGSRDVAGHPQLEAQLATTALLAPGVMDPRLLSKEGASAAFAPQRGEEMGPVTKTAGNTLAEAAGPDIRDVAGQLLGADQLARQTLMVRPKADGALDKLVLSKDAAPVKEAPPRAVAYQQSCTWRVDSDYSLNDGVDVSLPAKNTITTLSGAAGSEIRSPAAARSTADVSPRRSPHRSAMAHDALPRDRVASPLGMAGSPVPRNAPTPRSPRTPTGIPATVNAPVAVGQGNPDPTALGPIDLDEWETEGLDDVAVKYDGPTLTLEELVNHLLAPGARVNLVWLVPLLPEELQVALDDLKALYPSEFHAALTALAVPSSVGVPSVLLWALPLELKEDRYVPLASLAPLLPADTRVPLQEFNTCLEPGVSVQPGSYRYYCGFKL